ncbi:CD63 antigen [Schistosoma japonicum]|uniref:Tetraspanin n=2 Tax=Schistosoma japonicum TaxID=6182 RepID=F6LHS8_SCHJA|nr:tetrapanion 2 [Schistosoma japonicum]KAH8848983.1 CD63 antigen [Schistosoma japonicum]CAX70617.1 CD63 antigen [Schistosoma japonicum]CAX75551.1 CD63 antigen [Schistosoma japonicum]
MALGCGYKCLQCLLIIFNSGVFICGIGLIVVGALGLHSTVNHWKEIDPPLQSLIIFIIALGCFLFVLGALGMFGACTKNVCLLTTYCILLSVLIIAQIAAGIYAIIEKPKAKRHVTTALKDLVKQYGNDRHLDTVLDEIQRKLQCCGAESPNDYTVRTPASCEQYNEGCIGKVTELTRKHLNATIVTVFIFALLQMICLVFAVCVLMAIKRGDDE